MAFIVFCSDKTGLSQEEITLFDSIQADSLHAYADDTHQKREIARQRILVMTAKLLENTQLPVSWRRSAEHAATIFATPRIE